MIFLSPKLVSLVLMSMYVCLSSITGPRFLSALFIIMFGLFFICSRAFISFGCLGNWLCVYVASICSTNDSNAFREWLMYCSMCWPAGGALMLILCYNVFLVFVWSGLSLCHNA